MYIQLRLNEQEIWILRTVSNFRMFAFYLITCTSAQFAWDYLLGLPLCLLVVFQLRWKPPTRYHFDWGEFFIVFSHISSKNRKKRCFLQKKTRFCQNVTSIELISHLCVCFIVKPGIKACGRPSNNSEAHRTSIEPCRTLSNVHRTSSNVCRTPSNPVEPCRTSIERLSNLIERASKLIEGACSCCWTFVQMIVADDSFVVFVESYKFNLRRAIIPNMSRNSLRNSIFTLKVKLIILVAYCLTKRKSALQDRFTLLTK
jgi:hypothetical protein